MSHVNMAELRGSNAVWNFCLYVYIYIYPVCCIYIEAYVPCRNSAELVERAKCGMGHTAFFIYIHIIIYPICHMEILRAHKRRGMQDETYACAHTPTRTHTSNHTHAPTFTITHTGMGHMAQSRVLLLKKKNGKKNKTQKPDFPSLPGK